MKGGLTCRYVEPVSEPASGLKSSLTRAESTQRSAQEDRVRRTCTHAERVSETVPRHTDKHSLRLEHHQHLFIFTNDKDLQYI